MLGALLKDLRITYHISRQILVDGGLCSLDMLKKYESGQKQPEKLLGDVLWQRLGKSMEKFEIFLEQDEYELAGKACVGRGNTVSVRKYGGDKQTVAQTIYLPSTFGNL